jgi:hypothetical protein
VWDAIWSPRGDQIALLGTNATGSGVIWLFDPNVDGESLRQVVPPNADAANLGSVTGFSWLPNGLGLAYILAPGQGDENPGGQMYTLDLETGARQVVATPGRGGPAAQIVTFTVSPDGKSIAYTIASPVDGGWQFHSMWVRSLKQHVVHEVPVPDTERVNAIWWVASGLAWEQQTGEQADYVLITKTEDLYLLLSRGPDVPASPVSDGTPLATPELATPLAEGTPQATPVPATPAASPAAASPIAATPST